MTDHDRYWRLNADLLRTNNIKDIIVQQETETQFRTRKTDIAQGEDSTTDLGTQNGKGDLTINIILKGNDPDLAEELEFLYDHLNNSPWTLNVQRDKTDQEDAALWKNEGIVAFKTISYTQEPIKKFDEWVIEIRANILGVWRVYDGDYIEIRSGSFEQLSNGDFEREDGSTQSNFEITLPNQENGFPKARRVSDNQIVELDSVSRSDRDVRGGTVRDRTYDLSGFLWPSDPSATGETGVFELQVSPDQNYYKGLTPPSATVTTTTSLDALPAFTRLATASPTTRLPPASAKSLRALVTSFGRQLQTSIQTATLRALVAQSSRKLRTSVDALPTSVMIGNPRLKTTITSQDVKVVVPVDATASITTQTSLADVVVAAHLEKAKMTGVSTKVRVGLDNASLEDIVAYHEDLAETTGGGPWFVEHWEDQSDLDSGSWDQPFLDTGEDDFTLITDSALCKHGSQCAEFPTTDNGQILASQEEGSFIGDQTDVLINYPEIGVPWDIYVNMQTDSLGNSGKLRIGWANNRNSGQEPLAIEIDSANDQVNFMSSSDDSVVSNFFSATIPDEEWLRVRIFHSELSGGEFRVTVFDSAGNQLGTGTHDEGSFPQVVREGNFEARYEFRGLIFKNLDDNPHRIDTMALALNEKASSAEDTQSSISAKTELTALLPTPLKNNTLTTSIDAILAKVFFGATTNIRKTQTNLDPTQLLVALTKHTQSELRTDLNIKTLLTALASTEALTFTRLDAKAFRYIIGTATLPTKANTTIKSLRGVIEGDSFNDQNLNEYSAVRGSKSDWSFNTTDPYEGQAALHYDGTGPGNEAVLHRQYRDQLPIIKQEPQINKWFQWKLRIPNQDNFASGLRYSVPNGSDQQPKNCYEVEASNDKIFLKKYNDFGSFTTIKEENYGQDIPRNEWLTVRFRHRSNGDMIAQVLRNDGTLFQEITHNDSEHLTDGHFPASHGCIQIDAEGGEFDIDLLKHEEIFGVIENFEDSFTLNGFTETNVVSDPSGDWKIKDGKGWEGGTVDSSAGLRSLEMPLNRGSATAIIRDIPDHHPMVGVDHEQRIYLNSEGASSGAAGIFWAANQVIESNAAQPDQGYGLWIDAENNTAELVVFDENDLTTRQSLDISTNITAGIPDDEWIRALINHAADGTLTAEIYTDGTGSAGGDLIVQLQGSNSEWINNGSYTATKYGYRFQKVNARTADTKASRFDWWTRND